MNRDDALRKAPAARRDCQSYVRYNWVQMDSASELANLLRVRDRAFAHFAVWEASHRPCLTPADAVASIGALYVLLPPESRRRPVDPTGIARMHDALRHLSR